MDTLDRIWRPLPGIRTKALAIVQEGGALLLCAVRDDFGGIIGWRPLGGSVEFGETAAQTVIRELAEEIGATATVSRQIAVMENIYTHEGQQGHEIVFLFETTLTDPGLAAQDEFIVTEADGTRHHAAWVPLQKFTSGQRMLLPDGLLAHL